MGRGNGLRDCFGLEDLFVPQLVVVDPAELDRELLLEMWNQSTGGEVAHVFTSSLRNDNMVTQMEVEGEQQQQQMQVLLARLRSLFVKWA